MSEHQPKGSFKNIFKIGTPECAVFSGAAAMVLALLFLVLGFWRTVLVALVAAAGAILGGVTDKKEWLKKLINRLVPDRKQVPYRESNPAIVRAVREATESGKEPVQTPDPSAFQDAADDDPPSQE